MTITGLRISNFRGIKSLDLEIGKVTVLIGENNAGKTSVLDALKLCLRDFGPGRREAFEALDFHLPDSSAEPSSVEPIEIEITFAEREKDEWTEQSIARLSRTKILQVGDNGLGVVRLQVTCKFDQTTKEPDTSWSFLDLSGQPLPVSASGPLRVLREVLQYHYLTALRAAGHHFSARGPFWRPFIGNSQLTPEKKQELESLSQKVNALIVSSHTTFEQVQSTLSRLQSLVPLAGEDIASIEAVPTRMFDMLSRAEVQIRGTSGAKIPLIRHGEGTQSLAVLMLFSAFL